MSSPRYGRPPKLHDCKLEGPGADNELFIVEGDSAASSVAGVCCAQSQAVLPMQGKPLNTSKASEARIRANPWFAALLAAMGTDIGARFEQARVRYRRILLLFDPDADGIHCGALMMMFFGHHMPDLLDAQRVHLVRAPLLRISAPGLDEPVYARSEAHHDHVRRQLMEQGVADLHTLRYRGLGSLERDLLLEQCVNPASRFARPLSTDDAAMAERVFSGR